MQIYRKLVFLCGKGRGLLPSHPVWRGWKDVCVVQDTEAGRTPFRTTLEYSVTNMLIYSSRPLKRIAGDPKHIEDHLALVPHRFSHIWHRP
jgi:hypothetical protein